MDALTSIITAGKKQVIPYFEVLINKFINCLMGAGIFCDFK